MLQLHEIVDRVQAYHPSADVDLIRRAYNFSAKAHQGQIRKSGEPYVTHPLEVSALLADMRLDEHAICAGILHDTVEDTDATCEQIEELFGRQVADIVDGVTKLNIPFNTQFEKQAENFRRMLVAMAKDIRVILVKLADRLHNMQTLQHMRADKQERIAQETLEIYAPLANRLGIFWLKSALEDLCLKYLHPRDYENIQKKLSDTAADRNMYMQDVHDTLLRVLKDEGLECEVKGRVKHAFSIWRKLKTQNLEFEQIHDIMAFRVLVRDIGECYRVLGRCHQTWRPIPGRFKDFIAMPKPNGYQSLHTTVIGPDVHRVEIQIRTREMHDVAENGIAAHWAYKEGKPAKDDADQFDWLRQLMVWQRELKDPTEFISSVKVDLFSDEVYIFTPKGEVKELKRGSTPIDFAYLIHTEIGHHCVGARVNGRIVPLRYKLRNGDTVEILSSTQQRPNKDWLSFVRTSRARNRINAYLRTEERRRAVQLGHDLLEKEAKRHGRSLQRLTRQGAMDRVVQQSRAHKKSDDLLAAIGYGKVRPLEILRKMIPDEIDGDPKDESQPPSGLGRLIQKLAKQRNSQSGVVVEGINDMLVRFAKCCAPVPGDPIVGYVTMGRGITVHSMACDKALHLDPERKLEVSWTDNDQNTELRQVQLRVVSEDKAGLLSSMSSVFTEAHVNIHHANCKTQRNGQAVNVFQISVRDAQQLRKIIRGLDGLTGVVKVERLGA